MFARFLDSALNSTDARINEGKPITPAFLFASMLWKAVQDAADRHKQEGQPTAIAMQNAMTDVLSEMDVVITTAAIGRQPHR